MNDLMFGISGVRGIVGKSLTPSVVMKLGKAFGTFIYKNMKKPGSKSRHLKIVVGRDDRSSSEELKKSFIEGLLYCGGEVIDMGMLPTPVLLFNIMKTKSCGGAVITASHNPAEWNGIKFAGPRGIFVSGNEIGEIYHLFKTDSFIKGIGGKVIIDTKGSKRHLIAIVDSIDRDTIRGREFKIAIDSPWFYEISRLFHTLGCKVFEVNSLIGGEPLANNLAALSKCVVSNYADVGFTTDADGDRLGIVTEKGEVLDSEYTLPLVANWVLKRRKGLVVTNLSTSRMIDDIVTRNECRLRRTRVGEINVVELMLECGAVFGGEGNGGIIDPFIHYTRDSFIGMCRILESMASSGEKISMLANELPKYYMRKEKIEDSRSKVKDFDSLIKLFPEGKINREDGLRVDFEAGWVHIRESNTEPIIRLICETNDKNLTDSLLNRVLKIL